MTTLTATEARFNAAVQNLKQARADLGRSKRRENRVAFAEADAEFDAALAAFRVAQDADMAQRRTEARAARLAARPENRQMEMFA